MIHSQNTQAPREELTAAIIDAKMRKNLSWQELADGTGLSLTFVTAALLGPLRKSSLSGTAEVLNTLQKSVTIWRRLAADNPARHEPELARALHDLANQLGQAEMDTEATLNGGDSAVNKSRLGFAVERTAKVFTRSSE